MRVDRLDLAPVPKAAAKARWIPPPNTTWQWQLTTPVDLSVDAQLFDIDLFDNAASVVVRLHSRGRHVACYLDAGTLEPGRPDSGDFPASVVGKELPDWPGEHWLDVRRLDVLGPLLERRLDLCRQKGFDAVEPDNVDAYANDSGFPLTRRRPAALQPLPRAAAHARGLSSGSRTTSTRPPRSSPTSTGRSTSSASSTTSATACSPSPRAGKAVFVAEYELDTASFCARARAAGLMAMRKRVSLDAWRETCW